MTRHDRERIEFLDEGQPMQPIARVGLGHVWMLVQPDRVAGEQDAFRRHPHHRRRQGVPADPNQPHFASAARDGQSLLEGDFGPNDLQVVELHLDVRFFLEGVAHPLFEILRVAAHFLPGALMRHHRRGQVELIAE